MGSASAWGPKCFCVSQRREETGAVFLGRSERRDYVWKLGQRQGEGLLLTLVSSRPNKGWCPGLCCGRGVTGWCHPRKPAALRASHWLGEGYPETGALQLPPLPTVSGRLSSLGSLQKSFFFQFIWSPPVLPVTLTGIPKLLVLIYKVFHRLTPSQLSSPWLTSHVGWLLIRHAASSPLRASATCDFCRDYGPPNCPGTAPSGLSSPCLTVTSSEKLPLTTQPSPLLSPYFHLLHIFILYSQCLACLFFQLLESRGHACLFLYNTSQHPGQRHIVVDWTAVRWRKEVLKL